MSPLPYTGLDLTAAAQSREGLCVVLLTPAGQPTVQLLPEACTWVYDADSLPRTTASVTLPWDDRVWPLVARWANTRVAIRAGWRTGSNRKTLWTVADLTVRRAGRDLDAGTIVLQLADDASLVGDLPLMVDTTFPAYADLTAIRSLVTGALPGAVVTGTGGTPAAIFNIGTPRLQALQELLDGSGAADWVQLGPDRTWRVKPTPNTTDPVSWTSTVGPAGTVGHLARDWDRDQLVNGLVAVVRLFDTGGNQTLLRSVATVTTGPYAWGGPYGKRALVQDVQDSGLTTQVDLDVWTNTRLQVLRRARQGWQLTEPLVPWLQAGDTILVGDPVAGDSLHTAWHIECDGVAHTMTVDTKGPADTDDQPTGRIPL